MTMKETLLEAMHVPSDSETARWMSDRGVAVTDVDTWLPEPDRSRLANGDVPLVDREER